MFDLALLGFPNVSSHLFIFSFLPEKNCQFLENENNKNIHNDKILFAKNNKIMRLVQGKMGYRDSSYENDNTIVLCGANYCTR
jgi:hypothetical protein